MLAPPRRLRSLAACAFALALLAALPALAANKNFAGSWKKNLTDSEAQQGQPVLPETMTVSLEGESLTVDRTAQVPDQGERSVKFTYRENNGPYEIPALVGPPRVVTTRWSGDKLVVKYNRKFGNIDAEIIETWKMKGKQLEIKYAGRSSVGAGVAKQYYDRVE